MKVDPTLNPERENEIRRLQGKIHESIQAAFNDSKNHGRFIINSNVSHAMDNILKQQTEDGGDRLMINDSFKFHVIEQVEQSIFHSKSIPNEEKIDNDGRLSPKQKYLMRQEKVHLMRLHVAKKAAYNAIFDTPGKLGRFTSKYLHVTKCARF